MDVKCYHGFDLHFSNVEHLFIRLLAICISSFKKIFFYLLFALNPTFFLFY